MKVLVAISAIALSPSVATAHSEQFAVAGIHLGDRPWQVSDALLREGYKNIKVRQSPSYKARLAGAYGDEVRRKPEPNQPKGVSSISAVNRDQDIAIKFDDDAAGKRVVISVLYESSSVSRPFPLVRDKLVQRYGSPTVSAPIGTMWCVHDELDACREGYTNHTDRLAVQHEGNGFGETRSGYLTTIHLDVGHDALKEWNAAHRADLKRLLGSKDAF